MVSKEDLVHMVRNIQKESQDLWEEEAVTEAVWQKAREWPEEWVVTDKLSKD